MKRPVQTKTGICGVITLYQPPENLLHNIQSYISHIDKLFIVDNSPVPDTALHRSIAHTIGKTEVLSRGTNHGIAKALNLAISKSMEENYSWLLTMDQDSYFTGNEAERYFTSLSSLDHKKTAIISPKHKKTPPDRNPCIYRKKDEVMTSGNLLNLPLTKTIGLFNEQLFIDSVDHEFCLRANMCGYDVLESENCHIAHTIGTPFTGSFAGGIKTKSFNIHPPKRMYFIVRNGLYIIKNYNERFPDFTETLRKSIHVKTRRCIKYSTNKKQYLHYITKALIHHARNVYGNAVNM